MPFGLIQIEQERSDLWKAEVEAGFPICKRKMLHGSTFEDVMAKVAETYREMVPVPAPKEPTTVEAALMVSSQCEWPARGTATVPADAIIGHRERLSVTRALADGGTPSIGPTEPADELDAPEASEAGEIETDDLAASAEPAKPRRGRPPKVA